MDVDYVVAGYVFNERTEDDTTLLPVQNNKLGLWLPPGGHLKHGEIFDVGVCREIKEETNLDVVLLNMGTLPVEGTMRRNLAVPFYVNVHSAAGRNNHCFFYICRALNPEELRSNPEVKDARWHSLDDLRADHIPPDVKSQGRLAFAVYMDIRF